MTAPWVLDHAPYTPFMESRTSEPPGLSPMDPALWVERLPDFEAQMARRREIMADDIALVVGTLSEGEEAGIELLEELLAFSGEPRALTEQERFCPFIAMGHRFAEDFCLLLPDPASGEYRLVGAILCFPSRWLLSEKLGRPLTVIHEPVPDYGERLSRRVNRVFEALRVGRPLYRINWLVHATSELHLPLGASDKLVEAYGDKGPFYLRTERQTLVRLPRSGAIAFGIKTTICPIEALTPEQASGLYNAFAALDPDVIAYRAGGPLHAAALAALAPLCHPAAQA